MGSLTAEVLGSGVVGAAVGWGLSFISSERSSRNAQRQAAQAPEFVRSRRRAEKELAQGKTVSLSNFLEGEAEDTE